MIRTIITLFTFLLLTGCGEEDKITSSKKSNTKSMPTLSALKKDVDVLAAHDKKTKQQFDDLYKHIKNANKQLPKLNNVIQGQIQQQSQLSKSSAKQVNRNAQQQFKQIQSELNSIGKEIAAKGY